MAENKDWNRLRLIVKLMESGEYKNGCFTHSWFGLAKHIDSHDWLWNALLLYFRWVLKTAVCDCFHELRFEQKIFEACRMNTCELQLIPMENA